MFSRTIANSWWSLVLQLHRRISLSEKSCSLSIPNWMSSIPFGIPQKDVHFLRLNILFNPDFTNTKADEIVLKHKMMALRNNCFVRFSLIFHAKCGHSIWATLEYNPEKNKICDNKTVKKNCVLFLCKWKLTWKRGRVPSEDPKTQIHPWPGLLPKLH